LTKALLHSTLAALVIATLIFSAVEGYCPLERLKNWALILQRCYKFYESEFLIDFSRQLMDCVVKNGDKIVVIDNHDGTRFRNSK
jgi:hypothetical protein